jgi:hypothetical protein
LVAVSTQGCFTILRSKFDGSPKIIRDAVLLAEVKFHFLLQPILRKKNGGKFKI